MYIRHSEIETLACYCSSLKRQIFLKFTGYTYNIIIYLPARFKRKVLPNVRRWKYLKSVKLFLQLNAYQKLGRGKGRSKLVESLDGKQQAIAHG